METNGYNYQQPMYGERPMPSMIEATKACLRKYATFSGRARRSEYWWFFLAAYLAGMVVGLIWALLLIAQLAMWGVNGTLQDRSPYDIFLLNPGFWLYVLFTLAYILPSLAVTVRRLHDIGKSGWYLLIWMVGCPLLFAGAIIAAAYNHDLWFLMIIAYLVNLAVAILFIVWMASNGKKETNKWGPSPKFYPIEQNGTVQPR